MKQVYEYTDVVVYLQDVFQDIKAQRPRYSLRSWSQKLGFRSAATLSRLLSRQRRPTLSQIRTIAKGLGLSPQEALYLETLIQFQGAHLEMLAPQLKALFKKTPHVDTLKVSLENFATISEWYYNVIQAALCLDRTFRDPEDFYAVMDEKLVSLDQIKKALRDLTNLGLIKFENGTYQRTKTKVNFVEPEAASAAVRSFHSQMLGFAQKSIHEVPREQRDIRGLTLSFKNENFEEVQEILMEAVTKIMALSENKKGGQVYHLATAFFPMSKQV